MTHTKFATERDLYGENLQTWLALGHVCQFVVICGSEILGIYKSAPEAFDAGVRKYGAGNFFMKAIMPVDSTDISFFGHAI